MKYSNPVKALLFVSEAFEGNLWRKEWDGILCKSIKQDRMDGEQPRKQSVI